MGQTFSAFPLSRLSRKIVLFPSMSFPPFTRCDATVIIYLKNKDLLPLFSFVPSSTISEEEILPETDYNNEAFASSVCITLSTPTMKN